MANLKQLFQYYRDNQDDFVKKYDGKYILITSDGVKGAFDTQTEGYDTAIKDFGKGNFMLQLCTKGDEAYSQHFFTSRVAF